MLMESRGGKIAQEYSGESLWKAVESEDGAGPVGESIMAVPIRVVLKYSDSRLSRILDMHGTGPMAGCLERRC